MAALAVGLSLVFHRTNHGLAVLGASENPSTARALGWSTDTIGLVTWTVGAALAGLAGVLIVPFSGLDTEGLTLVLIAALAAALVSGFNSFTLAAAAALAIGMCQSILPNYVNQQGVPEVVPLLVIMVGADGTWRRMPLVATCAFDYPNSVRAPCRNKSGSSCWSSQAHSCGPCPSSGRTPSG